jgi:hypothetical protein
MQIISVPLAFLAALLPIAIIRPAIGGVSKLAPGRISAVSASDSKPSKYEMF